MVSDFQGNRNEQRGVADLEHVAVLSRRSCGENWRYHSQIDAAVLNFTGASAQLGGDLGQHSGHPIAPPGRQNREARAPG